MSATQKKVIVRQWNGDLHRGYLPVTCLAPEGYAELLLPDARALKLPMASVKHVAFVRDFDFTNPHDPERIGLRAFQSKPRSGGAWVKVIFTDDDDLEGLVQAGLPLLDTFALEQGIFLEPPDKRSNTQRLFVPRGSMKGFELLGIAGMSPKGRRPRSSVGLAQGSLFGGAHEG